MVPAAMPKSYKPIDFDEFYRIRRYEFESPYKPKKEEDEE